MYYLWLALYGLIAGILAKWVFPGQDRGGLLSTSLLGVLGALLAGFVLEFIGVDLPRNFSIAGLSPAIAGVIVILSIKRLLFKSSN